MEHPELNQSLALTRSIKSCAMVAQFIFARSRPTTKDFALPSISAPPARTRAIRDFLAPSPPVERGDVARFTELDFDNQVGLTATTMVDGRERFIGIGRYFRGENRTRAEIAFAVLDAHQGQGIATLLLEHLRHASRIRSASKEFVADVMASNRHMLDVFRESGFQRKSSSQHPAVVRRAAAPTAKFLTVSPDLLR